MRRVLDESRLAAAPSSVANTFARTPGIEPGLQIEQLPLSGTLSAYKHSAPAGFKAVVCRFWF